jgi:N-acetylmuramoyl-L-alanine amidase
VNRVFLHCSASEAEFAGKDLVDLIDGWHLERGFDCIGYHFVIDKRGARLDGRSLEKTPAAQKGHNRMTIAICAHGLHFPPEWYKGKQARAILDLCQEINLAYSGLISYWPHNAVSNKACPVFDVEQLLNLDRFRRMP